MRTARSRRHCKKRSPPSAHLGVSARFDPTLVRGLGYYTGQIFEISHPDVSYSLAGGGRYDGMTGPFRRPGPADVRFLHRFRTHLRHGRTGIFSPPGRTKVAVTCATEEELLRSLAAARARRENEPLLVINVVRRARNARKQQEDLT